jgi:hypothetical protein
MKMRLDIVEFSVEDAHLTMPVPAMDVDLKFKTKKEYLNGTVKNVCAV